MVTQSTNERVDMRLTKKELLASAELATYLDGLKDAQLMTPAELKRAIKIVQEAEF